MNANQKYRQNNPLAYKAHNKVGRAIRSGKLIRPNSCEKCFKKCKPEAHHEDYTQPFNIQWLCTTCHGQLKTKVS